MNQKETNGQNEIERDYEIYLTERKALIKGEKEQSNSFDKYLLTLAGGTFGLTVTFIDKILSKILPQTKWLISIAWAMLTSSILFILISFITSQKAYRKQIDIIEKIYVTHRGDSEKYNNCWSTITGTLNVLATILFTIGIVFLFIFVVKNL